MKRYTVMDSSISTDNRLPSSSLPPGAERKKHRLLLVEDNVEIRLLLARIITAHGLDVHHFPDGESALGFVDNDGRCFDILVTDLVLPGMSGKQVYEQLRARGAVRKAILISGYADDLVAEAGRPNDDVDALHKPFDPDALIARIRAALPSSTT